MKQKRSIQIETLTDIGLAVCNAVQTTESTESGEECICLLAYGYDSQEDREIEIPIFISIEKARDLACILNELTNK